MKYTRVRKKEVQMVSHQSALTNHVGLCNHTVDWEKVRLLAMELKRMRRSIQEAIQTKKSGPHTINWGKGCHNLFRTSTPDCFWQCHHDQVVQLCMSRNTDNATSGCGETVCW